MKVETIAQYFNNLKLILGPSGAKPELMKDLEAIVSGLSPFAQLSVKDFSEFLPKAWHYNQTGELPVVPSKKKETKAAKPDSAAKIHDITHKLLNIYESAKDPSLTLDALNERLQIVTELKPFKKDDIVTIAHGIDLKPAKTLTKDKMIDSIAEAIRSHWFNVRRLDQ